MSPTALSPPLGVRNSNPPTENMQAWYDASDVATLTITANKVSAWADKSPSGFDLAQGTAGVRPLYNATPRKINGVIIPEWTAAGEFMTSSLPTSSRTTTTFFAGLLDNLSASRTIVGTSASGGQEVRIFTNALIQTLKGGVTVLSSGPNLYPSTTKPFVFCQRLTATTIEHSVVGNFVVNAEATTFTGGLTFRLGLDQSGTVPWDGLIAEVVRYSTELNDDEVGQVLDYLVAKWMRLPTSILG